jgi:hypothetical protein
LAPDRVVALRGPPMALTIVLSQMFESEQY